MKTFAKSCLSGNGQRTGSSSPGGMRAEEVENGAESQISSPLLKKNLLVSGFLRVFPS